MNMPGSYHIITLYAQPYSMRVRCHQEGRDHRHATHIERFIETVCKKTIPYGPDNCCNISIANPNWDKNWCRDCVTAFPWTDEGSKMWLEKHGIETTGESPILEENNRS